MPALVGYDSLGRQTRRTINMHPQLARTSYVLVTAAYNEGELIENTIQAVVNQELRPTTWVIVSDGSTDGTDAIVLRYAEQYPFIKLHRLSDDHPRNFTAQVHAINSGIAQLRPVEYQFIGNLDADVTFAPTYFRDLLKEFQQDPLLGLAGGVITEKGPEGVFRARPDNSLGSVAHAVQLFRRECFLAIGGRYRPLPHGGPDTFAEVSVRMHGWRTTSFAELQVRHHRLTSSAGGLLRGFFRQGRMDHSLGTLPAFELLKVVRRIHLKPVLLGALTRFAGFAYAGVRSESRAVPDDFVQYFRGEQSARIGNLLRLKFDHAVEGQKAS